MFNLMTAHISGTQFRPVGAKKFYITYLDQKAATAKIQIADGGVGVLDSDVIMAPLDITDPFEIEGTIPDQKNHTFHKRRRKFPRSAEATVCARTQFDSDSRQDNAKSI